MPSSPQGHRESLHGARAGVSFPYYMPFYMLTIKNTQSQWVLALYINTWRCSARCNKNLKHKMWKQFKKTDLTVLPLSESESHMLWLKSNICRHLKFKYTGIHIFLHSRCFTAAFFILNIKNITLFYFKCQTPCLCILHIALSPPSSGSNPAPSYGNKKHLKILSRLISRLTQTTGYDNLTNKQTNKQIHHQLRCLCENVAEWTMQKGSFRRPENLACISRWRWGMILLHLALHRQASMRLRFHESSATSGGENWSLEGLRW